MGTPAVSNHNRRKTSPAMSGRGNTAAVRHKRLTAVCDQRYRHLLAAVTEAACIVDAGGAMCAVNQAFVRASGEKQAAALIGMSVFSLLSVPTGSVLRPWLRRLATGNRRACSGRARWRGFGSGSQSVQFRTAMVPAPASAKDLGLLVLSPLAAAEAGVDSKAYAQRLDNFKTCVATLSAHLIHLDVTALEQEIDEALRVIGECVQADRCYLFKFENDPERMSNTHEWCAAGVQAFKKRLQDVPLSRFPWITRQIRKGQSVCIADCAALPREAKTEQAEFFRERIKSLITVPLREQGAIVGFLGVDAVRAPQVWPEEISVLLRLCADIIAGVLRRCHNELQITTLNKELAQTNTRLKQVALRDSLTGLYNHRYFQETIEAEFERARRKDESLSVIMVDVDYFKSINDVYGHQFGDAVLKQLAKELTQMLRKYDTVVRFGGEEFIIITPGANRKITGVLAQRLLDVIKLRNFGNDQHAVKLKLSVAVAAYPDDDIRRGSDFLKIADYVLNKVKDQGGNNVATTADIKKRRAPAAVSQDPDVVELQDKLEKLTRRSNESLAEAIFAFAKTIEIKDHYTGDHVEKTVHYALEIARAMGLSAVDVERVRQAAVLHDLGKIGISERILLKKGKLTAREYAEIKKHPQIGVDILRPIHFFQGILPLILHHHERWDGAGYPSGLKKTEIPLGARIIAVADTFESLTADRCYRNALPFARAVRIMEHNAGSQFDPHIVKVFLEVIRRENQEDDPR